MFNLWTTIDGKSVEKFVRDEVEKYDYNYKAIKKAHAKDQNISTEERALAV